MHEVGLKKSELDTPVLWVDLNMLEDNVAHLADYFRSAGVQWRPHVKGIKVPAIAHQILRAGALGVTCAKLSEAEVMAASGIGDILIANQIVGLQKAMRLAHLCRRADVKVAVDGARNVAELGRAAALTGAKIGVVIEVDVGMNRAGVAPGQPAVALARLVEGTRGLRYAGLMAWEGQARRVMDLETRRSVIEEAVGQLTATADLCRKADLPAGIVSAGGTGTYHVTAHLPGVTEIQAGGAVFGDVASQSWGVETKPALFVRTMVTSRPSPDRIIFDAGFKALPKWHNTPEAVGLPEVASFDTSAEHGKLTLKAPDATIQVGQAFDFRVGYGDETVCLHDTMYGVRDGVVEVVWPILGRGKMQ
jgi:D-serine deaminase-like pyridoxal phosphate-dependent protein